MTLSEQLNEYMLALGCTARELSEVSGLSASVLSRYRTGSRVPEVSSEQFDQLVRGLAAMAADRGLAQHTPESIRRALEQCITEQSFPFETFQANFDALLTALSVNVSGLAHALNYDSSYISRIRSGQRRPADPPAFSAGVARYIVGHCPPADRGPLASLMGCESADIEEDTACTDRLTQWLSSGRTAKEDLVLPFLSKLDGFDLNEFIRSIRFDELKVPTLPFQLPSSRHYYGLEEMRKGTLDFFKATVLSRSREDLIANDDTPMADKAAGSDFMKKYIFAVALVLKKGLHVHFIHNINRPFEEMMMGLEGWIPMYMTGQISPYYIKGTHNRLFGHFLYSSGAAALSGECIMDHHEHGKMYLTNNRAEQAYYRQRARDILAHASPLMDIYRAESESAFNSFIQRDMATPGSRRSILSSLPLHTASPELLTGMLERHGVGEPDRSRILAFAREQRQSFEDMLTRGRITDEIPVISEEEFREHPMLLPLSRLFCERDIAYTYEEYRRHREQTLLYSSSHSGYTLRENSHFPFRNIQIHILEGKWVILSKNKAPAIHFVVHNPQLRTALENMVLPHSEG